MKHPDWPAFVASIVAVPDDDTLRLVAADFLEENGDTHRAAFIRTQVALAQLEASKLGKSLEADELRKKERVYLGPFSEYPLLWAMEECPELVSTAPPGRSRASLGLPPVEGADRLRWHRGFVERVDCPAAEWLRHGVAVRQRNPVREVMLRACYTPVRNEWYAGLEAFRGLRKLWLDLFPPQGRDAEFVEWLRRWLPETEVAGSPF
jgi:uncharacterized protein (TIGR02996 family)